MTPVEGRAATAGARGEVFRVPPRATLGATARDISIGPLMRTGKLAATVAGADGARSTTGGADTPAATTPAAPGAA